jgi:hypothetical protein
VDIEACLRDDATLPDLIPVAPGQIRVLVGSDPLAAAYARTTLAASSTRYAMEARFAAERELAYEQYREDELRPPSLAGVELLLDAQVDLGRALDQSVQAEVRSLLPNISTEERQRGVLRLVAA